MTVCETRVLIRKSSLEMNGPSFAASSTASAAFSPMLSMLVSEGISLPSMIWNERAFARMMSIGMNSKPLAYISRTRYMSSSVSFSLFDSVSLRRV